MRDAHVRFAAEIDALDALAAEGVVHIEGSRINVTEAGRPFVRLVAAAFDASHWEACLALRQPARWALM